MSSVRTLALPTAALPQTSPNTASAKNAAADDAKGPAHSAHAFGDLIQPRHGDGAPKPPVAPRRTPPKHDTADNGNTLDLVAASKAAQTQVVVPAPDTGASANVPSPPKQTTATATPTTAAILPAPPSGASSPTATAASVPSIATTTLANVAGGQNPAGVETNEAPETSPTTRTLSAPSQGASPGFASGAGPATGAGIERALAPATPPRASVPLPTAPAAPPTSVGAPITAEPIAMEPIIAGPAPNATEATTDATPGADAAPATIVMPAAPSTIGSQPEATMRLAPIGADTAAVTDAAPLAVADASTQAPFVAFATKTTPHERSIDTADDDIAPGDAASPVPSPTATQATDTMQSADGKIAAPPVHDAQFADALGARLSWLAERHIGHAEITLSPPQLGTLDVRLHIAGERVRAEFGSVHAEVRDAIQAHVPRLREMLSERGFTLTDAQVGGGRARAPFVQATPAPSADVALDAEAPAVPRAHSTHDGLLDAFA